MRSNKEQFNMYFPEGVKADIHDILSGMNEGKGPYDAKISIKDFVVAGIYFIASKKYPELSGKLKNSLNTELTDNLKSIPKLDVALEIANVRITLDEIKNKMLEI